MTDSVCASLGAHLFQRNANIQFAFELSALCAGQSRLVGRRYTSSGTVESRAKKMPTKRAAANVTIPLETRNGRARSPRVRTGLDLTSPRTRVPLARPARSAAIRVARARPLPRVLPTERRETPVMAGARQPPNRP
jgi:hypothetical protein